MDKVNSQFNVDCIILDNLKMISFMVMDSCEILLLIANIKGILNRVKNMVQVNRHQPLDQSMKANFMKISEVEKEN